MAFVPANPLEEVMLAASRGEAGAPALLDALRDSVVLVPGERGEGDDVSFPVLTHEGRDYVPLFTSPEQAQKAGAGQPGWLKLTGADLARTLGDEDVPGLALNPGGDLPMALPPEAVAALRGPGRQRFAAGTEVRVGLPANEPPELRDAVASWAHARADVRAVHRALVQGEGDPEPTLVLGLELAPGADADAAIEACVRNLPGVAAVVVSEQAADPVARFMRERDDPLYRRV